MPRRGTRQAHFSKRTKKCKVPLLVANTPEVRKYRLRYWDKGLANGDWSDTATSTVGP